MPSDDAATARPGQVGGQAGGVAAVVAAGPPPGPADPRTATAGAAALPAHQPLVDCRAAGVLHRRAPRQLRAGVLRDAPAAAPAPLDRLHREAAAVRPPVPRAYRGAGRDALLLLRGRSPLPAEEPWRPAGRHASQNDWTDNQRGERT